MADLKQINNGRQQSAYKEFKITLQPQEVYTLNNPFDYFRCLEATLPFNIAWSTNQMDTNFEAGLGIKFDDVIPYAQLFNPNNQPITIKVGVGIGYFDDSRLTVSGNVQTLPAQFNSFSAQTITIEDGKATIQVAEHTILQNTSENVMYVGGTGTDGLQLQPQGTFEFSTAAAVTVYGTDGDTIAVGSFN